MNRIIKMVFIFLFLFLINTTNAKAADVSTAKCVYDVGAKDLFAGKVTFNISGDKLTEKPQPEINVTVDSSKIGLGFTFIASNYDITSTNFTIENATKLACPNSFGYIVEMASAYSTTQYRVVLATTSDKAKETAKNAGPVTGNATLIENESIVNNVPNGTTSSQITKSCSYSKLISLTQHSNNPNWNIELKGTYSTNKVDTAKSMITSTDCPEQVYVTCTGGIIGTSGGKMCAVYDKKPNDRYETLYFEGKEPDAKELDTKTILNQGKKEYASAALNCADFTTKEGNNLLEDIYNLILLLGFVSVIILGTLDFAKAVLSQEAEAMKKATKRFTIRLISLLILLVIPWFIKFILATATGAGIFETVPGICLI